LSVVPLSVLYKNKIFIDNKKDIEPADFYKMIKTSKEMPSASQPTPGDFLKVYDEKIREGKEVVSIHISSKLSGTLNSARLASKQLKNEQIEIIDSEVVHMHCGFMSLKAAQMARDGAAINEIIDELKIFKNKIYSFFMPRSMENLIKGGRVSKIKGKMADLLEIKPILTLKDGEVSLFKNSRKWELSKEELLNIMGSLIKGTGKLLVSIGDVANKHEAGEMQASITQRFKPSKIIRTDIGIVVGSHLGIGGLGITFFEE